MSSVRCNRSFLYVEYLREETIEDIAKIAALVTPVMVGTISRTKLGDLLLPDTEGGKTILKRPTFDALVRLGFDIYSDDYILLDPDFYINY